MSWIDGLRHRLQVVLRSDAYAREQTEERRVHREMARLHDGPDLDPLRPDAPTPLPRPPSGGSGGFGVSRVLDVLRQDLAHALRSLLRVPGFTVLAACTLALGVGANGAVFSLLDQMFGQPPEGLEEPALLRRLYTQFPNHPLDPGMIFPFFHYLAFSAVEQVVEPGSALAAWTPSSEQTLNDGDLERTVRASWVTYDFFGVLGVGAARGRLFAEEEARVTDDVPVAVISHAFWKRGFALDPDVVGHTLRLDSTTFTIVGVTDEGFSGLDLSYTDVFLPLGTFPVEPQSGVPWHEGFGNYLHAVVRLDPGTTDRQLADQATVGYQRQVVPRGGGLDSTAVVVPGSIIAARGVGGRAGTRQTNQAISLSLRMAGVSLMVLLIAAANVAGLIVVRATRRRHEMAVRRALGVSRLRLISQLVTEGLLLTALAAVVAVPLAGWGGSILRRLLLPQVEWARGALDGRAVAFALASAGVVGLLAALTPALHSWWGTVGAGLKVSQRAGGRTGSALRSTLLATQAALAVVLLTGSALFVQSLQNIAALRLGFDVDELAWISLRGRADDSAVRVEMESRLAGLGGVSGTALASAAPMMGSIFWTFFLPGGDSLPSFAPGVSPSGNAVSRDYFAVTGMRILEGRTFADGAEDAVVVSETMARVLWPGEDALGECLVFDQPDAACHPVVGVTEDSRQFGIAEEPSMQYFRPREVDATGGEILFRVDPRRWGAVAEVVRNEFGARFGPREVRIRRMSDALEPQLRPWRLGAQLFTAFGLLALVVTLVGVYSVTAYAASQRRHEMGVRMAIGAQVHDIVALVVASGARVVALGGTVGIAVSLALGRIVESLLFEVNPRDPVAMTAAMLLLLLAGVTASLVPAWRAGRVDPARILREE